MPADRVDPARPSAALVAVGGFAGSSNINLALARRELDVASGQGAASFDPGSRFTDRVTDPAFRDFIARLGMTLGASGPLGLQFAQAFSSNPAAGLVAAETLAFVDLSLLGEELTLFGMIGAGNRAVTVAMRRTIRLRAQHHPGRTRHPESNNWRPASTNLNAAGWKRTTPVRRWSINNYLTTGAN